MPETSVLSSRMRRAQEAMGAQGVDALLLSVGHDLPYLTGYHAMPLERLTMLVLTADGDANLVVAELEAPRVERHDGLFEVLPWSETDDPLDLVAKLLGGRRRAAVGDQTWARFVLGLQDRVVGLDLVPATAIVGPLRLVKDDAEIAALRAAAHAADRVAADLQSGRIPLIGRTEAEVSAHIGRRLVEEGHQKVNFAIVASGPNAASPHHDAGRRVIQAGEVVLCDFGGTMDGYCSDITRCVFTGEPPAEFAELYDVLHDAQRTAVARAGAGVPAEEVDRTARGIIAEHGYGRYFIHRTGHGIGMEEHEDPYIVEGNRRPLVAGHAFSVEPGIYVPGRWGARLEDIVVAGADGPDELNRVDHRLVVVEA